MPGSDDAAMHSFRFGRLAVYYIIKLSLSYLRGLAPRRGTGFCEDDASTLHR